MTSSSDLPPYFGIDPEAAASRLAQPIDTTRFAKAAAFAARGRDDLARRGYAPDGQKRLRKFSTWEVCRYLIPVNPAPSGDQPAPFQRATPLAGTPPALANAPATTTSPSGRIATCSPN